MFKTVTLSICLELDNLYKQNPKYERDVNAEKHKSQKMREKPHNSPSLHLNNPKAYRYLWNEKFLLDIKVKLWLYFLLWLQENFSVSSLFHS